MQELVRGTITIEYTLIADSRHRHVLHDTISNLRSRIYELFDAMNDDPRLPELDLIGIARYTDESTIDHSGLAQDDEEVHHVSHKLDPKAVGLLYDLIEHYLRKKDD